MQSTAERIQHYHDKYFGSQDEAFQDSSSFTVLDSKNLPLKEGRKVTLYSTPDNRQLTHTLFNLNTESNVAYTHLSVTPISAVDSVSLEVGGQRIERVQRSILQGGWVGLDLMSASNYIPMLEKHDARLVIDTNRDASITIMYDVIVVDSSNTMKIAYDSEQASDIEYNNDTNFSLKLNFNHPVKRLYARLPDDTQEAKLFFDGEDTGFVMDKILNTKNEYQYHSIDFGKTTINFSRINNAELRIQVTTAHPDFPMRTYAVTKQILHIAGGMAGMAFSK